jgi:P-type Ca2+ transporter type 2C
MPEYYRQSVEETFLQLKTDLQKGLGPQEVHQRLREVGANEIKTRRSRGIWRILYDQIINPMILLLLAVVGISMAIGHLSDGLIIAVIVLLNSTIGFAQEFKAEQAMASIRELSAPQAKVIREGELRVIKAKELVPGDVVYVEAGDRIPADLRFWETRGLKVDESLLTGEAGVIFKESKILEEPHLTHGDQINMGFMGTHVVAGQGKGICVATGENSALGQIAQLVSSESAGELPLKQRMEWMTRWLVLAALFLCILIFGVGLLYGEPWLEMLMAALSLSVASLPEGLPAVITISLSLGAGRLVRQGVLVRRLQAVEALGSITSICADKTGTLTLNRMEVREVYLDGQRIPVAAFREAHEGSADFFQALVLCNDAKEDRQNKYSGDPTEVALLKFARAQGFGQEVLASEWPRVLQIPFEAERKSMLTVHQRNGKKTVYVKGAPEVILAASRKIKDHSEIGDLTPAQKDHLLEIQEKMAGDGLRLLAVAMKLDPISERVEDLESELIFLGMVGMIDPPREEVRQAIHDCRSAGIRPVMLTGDHPTTALAIGRHLGIYQEGDEVITGRDLREQGRKILDEKALYCSIFARISPEDKLRIVEVLQDTGQWVAMTGDGVNDAPALKKADVGIAMGRGTDAAKEASDLILVREDFSTIVRAVREGRVIYDNIRKFVRYMLTTNFGEILTMFFAILLGLPVPLLPVQILWINLVTDGLPAVALGFEKAEGDVMKRSPRDPQEGTLGRGLWQHTLWVGLVMGLLGVLVFFLEWKTSHNLAAARTVTFTALVAAQMGHVLAIRSETQGLWTLGLFSNYRLLVAVLLTMGSQFILLYLPQLQKIFTTTPLNPLQMVMSLGLGVVIYILVELEKILLRKNKWFSNI